jgi:hypothetical protein
MDPDLIALYAELDKLKHEVLRIEMAINNFKSSCKHDFMHERESDGHTINSIYTCKICRYATMLPRVNTS